MTLRPTMRVTATLALGTISALAGPQRTIAADVPPVSAPAETTAAVPAGELAGFGAVGFSVAEDLRLHELQWTPEQFEAFVAGLRASYRGKSYPVNEQTRAGFEAVRRQIHVAQSSEASSQAAAPPTEGGLDAFLQEMRRKLGLQQADSGLFFRIAKGGSGPRPRKTDVVTISFHATSPDAPNGLPQLSATNIRIKVSDLMPGLAEGVQMLALDGAAFLLLPPALSYGRGAWPAGVQPGTPLLFDVQLHDIEPAEAAP